MCLKVRTSFAANSEVALVVTGVDTVEPRNNAGCSSLTISQQTHCTMGESFRWRVQ